MTVVTTKAVTLSDGIMFELPFSDLLPDLPPDLYSDLKTSIEEFGIQTPILINEWNEVIDGQHRLLIARELGIPSSQIPQQLTLPDDGSPRADIMDRMRRLAIISNVHRRQLSPETRAHFVTVLRGEGLSNRAIANKIGVAESTVRNDLKRCSGAQNCAPEHPETATGTDGKTYPKSSSADTIAERRQRVSEAKAEGQSVRSIAEQEGVSLGTVAADLKALPEEEPELPEKQVLLEQTPPEPEVQEPDVDDDEFISHHRDRVRRHTSSGKDKIQENTDSSTDKLEDSSGSSRELKIVKLDADHWQVIVDNGDDEQGLACRPNLVVGLVTRGLPDGLHGYTAYAILPYKGEKVELKLSYNDASNQKTIVETIQKALKDPEGYVERHREAEARRWHPEPKAPPKFPPGPINDLELEDGKWKQHGLQTSSLWMFGARAKGPGRSGKYHGNFIPQVPDQIMRVYTHADDVVLDMFLGGGTTMVEAQRLKRHFFGIDLKQEAVYEARKLAETLKPNGSMRWLFQGDSAGPLASHRIRRSLHLVERTHVDHVFLHPPYWDVIKFSDGEDAQDLSSARSLESFLRMFEKIAWRADLLLKPGKFLSLVVGDVVKGPLWVPLGFLCMQILMKRPNLHLTGIDIKDIQGNEKGKGKNRGLYEYRALKNGTNVFAHEYVMIFRKGLEE